MRDWTRRGRIISCKLDVFGGTIITRAVAFWAGWLSGYCETDELVRLLDARIGRQAGNQREAFTFNGNKVGVRRKGDVEV